VTRQQLVIGAYLLAAVAANITVQYWGPKAMPLVAFLMVGLDLTSRDYLHECWEGKNLGLKMLGLIASGSVLTYLVNREAQRVALASFAAFACAGASDATSYALLRGNTRILKVNGSNLVSALVDSIVFPWAAFGILDPGTVLAQYAAKVGGGFVWSLVFGWWVWNR
jgi:uncharacterized PurR-regulated membrane protein YhhQ (DUF165 family)